MCGLVGVTKGGSARLLSTLKQLQYRGYDSFGIAVTRSGQISYVKEVGQVKRVEVGQGEVGIGHTRWATNGKVCVENAHPMVYKNFAVVQNGIIENHTEIRAKYTDFPWSSETDTECVLPLLEYKTALQGNFDVTLGDVEWLLDQLKGEFAILILDSITDAIYFIKKGPNPILIDKENGIICSDMDALFADNKLKDKTEKQNKDKKEKMLIEVVDNGFGCLSKSGLQIFPQVKYRKLQKNSREEMTHQNWFESEFFSQINSLEKSYYKFIGTDFPEITELDIIGSGSSYLAGKIGEWWFDLLTDVRVKTYFSADYKLLPQRKRADCVAAISQSGETADILSALKTCEGHKVGIINVFGSTMCTYVNEIIAVGAGREVSVASTKSTSCQMLAMFAWACYLKDNMKKNRVKIKKVNFREKIKNPPFVENAIKERDENKKEEASGLEIFSGMHEILPKMGEFIPHLLQQIDEIEPAQHIFILGSGGLFPIAMEAALKIKELAYLHAEAISCAEMKHGPLAILDEKVLVICFCPTWEPIIDEVASRGAQVLVFGREKINGVKNIEMLPVNKIYEPFIYLLAAQWLANSWGKRFGNLIDMPRNLAKSVTVV